MGDAVRRSFINEIWTLKGWRMWFEEDLKLKRQQSLQIERVFRQQRQLEEAAAVVNRLFAYHCRDRDPFDESLSRLAQVTKTAVTSSLDASSIENGQSGVASLQSYLQYSNSLPQLSKDDGFQPVSSVSRPMSPLGLQVTNNESTPVSVIEDVVLSARRPSSSSSSKQQQSASPENGSVSAFHLYRKLKK